VFQRWLLQSFSLLLLYLYLSPVFAEEQVGVATPYKGALCLIKANDKLILVNEILTKHLSLPGGTILPGEEPQQAAKRETWEETGIAVTVGDILGYTAQAVVFECHSPSEILVYQYRNTLGGYELPIWFAPDYGLEIASATLIDPYFLDQQKYRYPEDWDATLNMFTKATDQQIKIVSDLINAAPSFHQDELIWIQALQLWVNSLPNKLHQLLHNLFMFGNDLAAPATGIFIFPLLYWRCGKSVCYKVSFAISITSLVCLFAQQGFALPRPHVYFPNIQYLPSYGNGFPSLTVAVWSSIGMLLLAEREKLGDGIFVVVYCISAVWLVLSKFYVGSEFLVDMAVGGFIGLLISWNIIRFDIKRTERVRTAMGSKRVWWSITFVAALFTYFWQLPVFGAWLVVLVVMSLITSTIKSQREYLSLVHAVAFIVVLATIYMGISYEANKVFTEGLWPTAIEVIRYPVIIVVFVLMIKLTSPANNQLRN